MKKNMFWILSSGVVMLVAMYAFFIQTSIVYHMSRQALLEKSSSMEFALGDLEKKYFGLTEAVTLPVAMKLGFVNADSVKYLPAHSSLSLVNNVSAEGR